MQRTMNQLVQHVVQQPASTTQLPTAMHQEQTSSSVGATHSPMRFVGQTR